MKENTGCGPTGMVRAWAFLVAALAAPVAGQVTSRVSVDSSGAQGNGSSFPNSFSADGRYVAFESEATNLVPGDTNGLSDVFVRDRQLGLTERVSVGSGGAQANGESFARQVSANGRYVTFQSNANNLVPGDTNGVHDIFVRDRQLGLTERVSVGSAGAQGNDQSLFASPSADGRYVAFDSFATNLVPGDTNGVADTFVRDRQLGLTERVSVHSSGAQGNSASVYPSISVDGRYVAFSSQATNLVPGDTNAVPDTFVRDRQLGLTERVSVDSSGTQGNGANGRVSISADGRYVTFESLASNLVAGDTNGVDDAFVRDRLLGLTERVSVDSGGAQGNGSSFLPSISADGRYVAFMSGANNLVPGDTNGLTDVFVRDRQLGFTERVSIGLTGAQRDFDSFGSSISADGRYVAFASAAANLVPGDTNGLSDAFVRDRDVTGFTSLCDPGVESVIPCPCSNPPSGSGRGCDNFGAGPVDSGTLTATGVAHLQADTIVLTATGENNTSTTVFWTGKAPLHPTGVAHGAGVRCVSAALKRLYPIPGNGAAQAVGGSISRPGGLDTQSVSARTAALYGAAILPGETRFYFTIYRDPQAAAPCGNTSSTVNLTNAGAITWAP